MEFKRILVVDDEPLMRDFVVMTLQRNNKYVVEEVGDGAQALERLKNEFYDLVITDVRMPGISGEEVLKEVKKNTTDSEVVVITAFGTVIDAVEAMKLGAYDYIEKPFSADRIEIVVDHALENQRQRDEIRTLRNDRNQLRIQLKEKTNSDMIGLSDIMRKVYDTIEMIAPSKATILIHGESGTGKELVARAIHYNSDRQNKPFIKVNCAALPESLMESELFGHEKGAFTGAIRTTKGRFELAHTGTLLLDEIGELSLPLQSKLLRVLQEREFEKVGNPTPLSVDVRVIATTNRDLKKEIQEGNFREDLYYRLNVVPIYLPPLRERKEDIPLLVDHFRRKYCSENQRNISAVSDEALDKLSAQDWPGNVRELENHIERAVVLCRDQVLTDRHFQFEHEGSEKSGGFSLNGLSPGMTLREMEKQLILSTLASENNNRTRASEILGISVRTLRNKLNEYAAEGIKIP